MDNFVVKVWLKHWWLWFLDKRHIWKM